MPAKKKVSPSDSEAAVGRPRMRRKLFLAGASGELISMGRRVLLAGCALTTVGTRALREIAWELYDEDMSDEAIRQAVAYWRDETSLLLASTARKIISTSVSPPRFGSSGV